MSHTVSAIVALLGLAMLVAIAARRLRLPYTVGLVAVGAGIAALRIDPGVELTHDLIFDIILPPLLFEASLTLRWSELRADLAPIFVLSTVGTLISAGFVAWGMTFALHWPLMPALVFGALIAATDPVAVIAMFKDNRVEGRLRLLVESESLFNDGVAAVLFSIALAASSATGNALSPTAVARAFALSAVGGAGIGLAAGAAAILLAGRTSEHLIEAALTTIAAYGAFALAEYCGVSGVLATVAAGLLLGNAGFLKEEDSQITPEGRAFTLAFWDFAAFLANSIVFPLIGVSIARIPFDAFGFGAMALVIAIVLAARALTIYPLCLGFARSHWAIPLREQHVMWWSGLRGALALALALSLPPDLAFRNGAVIAAFGVVAFSIVVQGLTMPWLLRRTGVVGRGRATLVSDKFRQ